MTRDEVMELGCGTYLDARQLDDGSRAVMAQLLYTRAIMLGVTKDCAFETRYCYDDNVTCKNQFNGLKSKDDVPTGWIAKRPQDER